MAEYKIFKVQEQTECLYDCPTSYDFLRLTDEMVKTIGLEEELVHCRQVLIKYLPDDWADGLRNDTPNNTSHDFEGSPDMNYM